ncbi:MAG TPA: diacylglycerol kinase [Hellea balneolensis]|uniref:Diacylglycerol kinase n=1 Tax=Hellea balneolensis TaxID=287478 RepID=A0A7V5U177_9PROT|nr:diacylglycerol kinase [Hellea balneolensis]
MEKSGFAKRDARRALGLGPLGLFWYQLRRTLRTSFGGGAYLFHAELAAKIEFVLYLLVLVLYWFIDARLQAFLITTVLFLLLLAVEALNTAIEVIIDRISPEYSLTGKHAKDLGAFAVACCLLLNGIFIGTVVYQSLAG